MTTTTTKKEKERITYAEVKDVFPARFPSRTAEGFFRCCWCGYVFEEVPAADWIDLVRGRASVINDEAEAKLREMMKRSLYYTPAIIVDGIKQNPESVMCGKCSDGIGMELKIAVYRVEGDYKE